MCVCVCMYVYGARPPRCFVPAVYGERGGERCKGHGVWGREGKDGGEACRVTKGHDTGMRQRSRAKVQSLGQGFNYLARDCGWCADSTEAFVCVCVSAAAAVVGGAKV